MPARIKVYTGPTVQELREVYQEVLAIYVDELQQYIVRGRHNAHTVTHLQSLRATVIDAADAVINAWHEENPIRKARKERGIAAQKLAASAGLSHPTIQSWENGAVHSPSPDGMQKLADFLGIPNLWELWEEWHRQNPGIGMVELHIPPVPKLPEA